MRGYFLLLLGLGVGFTLGMISVWTSPMFIFGRIGEAVVMFGAICAFLYGLSFVVDLALKVFNLHKEFWTFVFRRAKARRGELDP